MRTKRRTTRSTISLLALTASFTLGGVAAASAECVEVWANVTVENIGPIGPDGRVIGDPGWHDGPGVGPTTVGADILVEWKSRWG